MVRRIVGTPFFWVVRLGSAPGQKGPEKKGGKRAEQTRAVMGQKSSTPSKTTTPTTDQEKGLLKPIAATLLSDLKASGAKRIRLTSRDDDQDWWTIELVGKGALVVKRGLRVCVRRAVLVFVTADELDALVISGRLPRNQELALPVIDFYIRVEARDTKGGRHYAAGTRWYGEKGYTTYRTDMIFEREQ